MPAPDELTATELATCAVHDADSRGRQFAEPEPAAAAPGLTGFALDRHRVLHCAAFRRLEHKTQVFVTHEGDHYRTRLTHTLEVAALARRLAGALRVNPTLAETIALAHDLGHPPFGHAGEAALAELMIGHGGFEHNSQSLRVVEYLEHPYPDFRGLNLTFETREGLIKHHTAFDHPADAGPGQAALDLPGGTPHPSLEAQLVNLADELAYTLHDVEDGLMHDLIDEAALARSSLWREAAGPWRKRWPDSHHGAIRRPVLDQLVDRLIADIAATSASRFAAAGASRADDVRRSGDAMAAFSDEIRGALDELQLILRDTVYRHPRVRDMDRIAREAVGTVFRYYVDDPSRLPRRYAERIAEQGVQRVACDYIAGMTDRFCLERARAAGDARK